MLRSRLAVTLAACLALAACTNEVIGVRLIPDPGLDTSRASRLYAIITLNTVGSAEYWRPLGPGDWPVGDEVRFTYAPVDGEISWKFRCVAYEGNRLLAAGESPTVYRSDLTSQGFPVATVRMTADATQPLP